MLHLCSENNQYQNTCIFVECNFHTAMKKYFYRFILKCVHEKQVKEQGHRTLQAS